MGVNFLGQHESSKLLLLPWRGPHKKGLPKEQGDKKQEDVGCADFIIRGVVSADVLVIMTTKHSNYMHVHRIPRRWIELEALV